MAAPGIARFHAQSSPATALLPGGEAISRRGVRALAPDPVAWVQILDPLVTCVLLSQGPRSSVSSVKKR